LFSFAPWNIFKQWQDQPVLKRDEAYMNLKNELGNRLLSQAEKYIPDLRANAEVIEIASPLTNTSFANTPLGSIYGLAHTPDQIGPGRWGVKSPVPGLLFCGADVLGAGIAPCVASGTMAGRAALKMRRKEAVSVPVLSKI
jgi:all-trans-retinol 13,14-reductase